MTAGPLGETRVSSAAIAALPRIYVTGHRNPDTDSIAAAVGYAELMGRVDPHNDYVPGAARRAQHADALGARARAARASPSSCRT